jgi:flagellar protein FliS
MHSATANEQYLQTTVLTASPAKLRSLLLDRAVGLIQVISAEREKTPDRLVDQWTLRLRDILGELLSGITRQSGPLAVQVSDLYVFLLQQLTLAEQEPGIERIESIGKILKIEQETWQLVCAEQAKQQQLGENAPPRSAVPVPNMQTGFGGTPNLATSGPPGGSLNLNA